MLVGLQLEVARVVPLASHAGQLSGLDCVAAVGRATSGPGGPTRARLEARVWGPGWFCAKPPGWRYQPCAAAPGCHRSRWSRGSTPSHPPASDARSPRRVASRPTPLVDGTSTDNDEGVWTPASLAAEAATMDVTPAWRQERPSNGRAGPHPPRIQEIRYAATIRPAGGRGGGCHKRPRRRSLKTDESKAGALRASDPTPRVKSWRRVRCLRIDRRWRWGACSVACSAGEQSWGPQAMRFFGGYFSASAPSHPGSRAGWLPIAVLCERERRGACCIPRR